MEKRNSDVLTYQREDGRTSSNDFIIYLTFRPQLVFLKAGHMTKITSFLYTSPFSSAPAPSCNSPAFELFCLSKFGWTRMVNDVAYCHVEQGRASLTSCVLMSIGLESLLYFQVHYRGSWQPIWRNKLIKSMWLKIGQLEILVLNFQLIAQLYTRTLTSLMSTTFTEWESHVF